MLIEAFNIEPSNPDVLLGTESQKSNHHRFIMTLRHELPTPLRKLTMSSLSNGGELSNSDASFRRASSISDLYLDQDASNISLNIGSACQLGSG